MKQYINFSQYCVKQLYEEYIAKPMPWNMSYQLAAALVLDKLGVAKVKQLLRQRGLN